MTIWLHFSDEHQLLSTLGTAIAGNLTVSRSRLVRRGEDIWIESSKIPKKVRQALKEIGVAFEDPPCQDSVVEIGNWAEAVLPTSTGTLGEGTQTLFVLPEEQRLIEVAGEMLRLGCQQQAFAKLSDERFLLRSVSPPYYTLARAYDRSQGLRAYTTTDSKVWVESGFEYSLSKTLNPADGVLVLIGRTPPWRRIQNVEWQDIQSIIRLEVGDGVELSATAAEVGEITVKVRLAPAPSQLPRLWVLRKNAKATMETFLKGTPQRVIDALLFAVVDDGEEPMVIVRHRPSKARLPVITMGAEAYCPHEQIPYLHLPAGTRLDPPLRRDTIRSLLAPVHTQLVWLHPTATGFVPESLDDGAFVPLSQWMRYVIDSDAKVLGPWIESALFEFESFEGVNMGPVTPAAPMKPTDPDRPPRRPRPQGRPRGKKKLFEPVTFPTEEKPVDVIQVDQTELLVELARVEQELLEADDRADSELWRQGAVLNTRLRRPLDAAQCWTRAIWRATPELSGALSEQWLAAECTQLGATNVDAMLEAALQNQRPDRDVTRFVAAYAGSSTTMDHQRRLEVQRWLDRYDENLDLRSFWLGLSALSHLAGGDYLTLARCRDRILMRIHGGMSIEEEVPSFVRRADSSLLLEQRDRSARDITALMERAELAKRARTPIEADPKLSWGYLRYVAAIAMARLAYETSTSALKRQADASIPTNDAVHVYLRKAFHERIEQALSSSAPETPLSVSVQEAYGKLDRFARYKVDRLAQICDSLSTTKADPFSAFAFGKKCSNPDLMDKAFDNLKGAKTPEQVTDEVMHLCDAAIADDGQRYKLLCGAMEYFARVPSAVALPHVEAMTDYTKSMPMDQRVRLLKKALMLSAHYGKEALSEKISRTLSVAFAALSAEELQWATDDLSAVLKTLLRLGMKDQAQQILAAFDHQKVDVHVGLHLGMAACAIGEMERAHSAYELALKTAFELNQKEVSLMEQLRIHRALGWLLSVFPRDEARSALETMEKTFFKSMTDGYNTNSHFCLTLISFVESLIIGYTGTCETIGTRARNWLYRDELEVRRRIHAEIG